VKGNESNRGKGRHGGGDGSYSMEGVGVPDVVETAGKGGFGGGGGGGGGAHPANLARPGAPGGSGIVIIRYVTGQ
jgi:hypothetical protein